MDAERRFLDGANFAKLTTLDASGAPRATVMWYRLTETDSVLRMIAPASSAKARDIERDARVTVIVDAQDNGYEYIEVRGRAELLRDDAGAREELRKIAARYIGRERGDIYAGSLSAEPRVIIAIHPERVRYHQGRPPLSED
jgi:PPOX class probable F420-dependent enzyme